MLLRPFQTYNLDTKMIKDIGYLMRTTAVYGNGKFGIADREDINESGYSIRPFYGRNAYSLDD